MSTVSKRMQLADCLRALAFIINASVKKTVYKLEFMQAVNKIVSMGELMQARCHRLELEAYLIKMVCAEDTKASESLL